MKPFQKITYSIGNVGNTIVYQAFTNRVQFFYIDALGVSAGLIGSMWILFGLWNAINDPLMGRISDKTNTRLGRRIPYLLLGGIPLGIVFFLMWIPPTGRPLYTAIWFLVSVFVFDTVLSMITMTYNSLFSELTIGEDQLKTRSSLSAIREAFAVVALLAAFILAPILSTSLGWWQMGAIIGGIGALTTMATVIGNREDTSRITSDDTAFVESLRETLSNDPFRWFLGANIAKEFVFLILAAALPFWSKYALAITEPATYFGVTLGPGDQEALLLGIPLLAAIPCMAIWQAVMKRIGVKRMWMIVFVMFIPGLLVVFFANSFATGLIGTMLVAPALSGSMMVYTVMLSQIVDEDEARTGSRRDGIYFGVNGAAVRLAFSLQGLLFGLVFWLTGFQEGGTLLQPESAIWGIRFLMAGAPILACLIGIVLLRRVKIPQAVQRHQQPREAIAK